MSTRKRDPWVDVKTYHGLPADHVISALQKEIRRGNTENAVLLAYEMVLTSPALEDYLWQRLMVISCESCTGHHLQRPVEPAAEKAGTARHCSEIQGRDRFRRRRSGQAGFRHLCGGLHRGWQAAERMRLYWR